MPVLIFLEQRCIALEVAAQAQDGLGVELVDTRLGDGEDFADLLEGQALIVVKGDN